MGNFTDTDGCMRKCTANNLKCKKEENCKTLQVLEPDGTTLRKTRKLPRRTYISNDLWHFDSYGKLKRSGICINSCIDGFQGKLCG